MSASGRCSASIVKQSSAHECSTSAVSITAPSWVVPTRTMRSTPSTSTSIPSTWSSRSCGTYTRICNMPSACRSAAQLGAVRLARLPRTARARSSPASVSVRVRSGARSRRVNARLRLPSPSASERKTSKQRTDFEHVAELGTQRGLDARGGDRCRRPRTRGRAATPGSATARGRCGCAEGASSSTSSTSSAATTGASRLSASSTAGATSPTVPASTPDTSTRAARPGRKPALTTGSSATSAMPSASSTARTASTASYTSTGRSSSIGRRRTCPAQAKRDVLGLVGQRAGVRRDDRRRVTGTRDPSRTARRRPDPGCDCPPGRAADPGSTAVRSTDSSDAQRVGGPHQPVERRTGALEVGGRHQRQRDGLREPHAHQRVGHEATLALTRGERADLAVGVGQRAADAVEADAARHLFDQVDLAVEVGTERGHDRDDGVAVAAILISAGLSSSMPSGARESHTSSASSVVPSTAFTRDARSVIRVALDRARVHVDRVGRDLRARHLDEQLHRPLRVAGDGVGVDAALEARARLAAQLEPLRRERDAHALEVGRLQQDLGGGVGHLGGGTAHDPGHRLRHALARRR